MFLGEAGERGITSPPTLRNYKFFRCQQTTFFHGICTNWRVKFLRFNIGNVKEQLPARVMCQPPAFIPALTTEQRSAGDEVQALWENWWAWWTCGRIDRWTDGRIAGWIAKGWTAKRLMTFKDESICYIAHGLNDRFFSLISSTYPVIHPFI